MKSRLSLIIVLVVSLFSCKEVDELTQFTMNLNTEISIPTNPVSGVPISITTPSVPTNSASTFSSRNTSSDLIEEIQLTKLELTLTNPAASNLDFFESVEVFISATDLPEISLASKTDIPDGLTVLSLTTSRSDIKEYIKKTDFVLRFAITNDNATSEDHDLNVEMAFLVDAKILGQ